MKAIPLPPITPQMAARFWSGVDVSQPKACWLWNGFIHPTGYGTFRVSPTRVAYTHRIAYQLFHGAVPDGLEIDHLCRVRHCVNPAHMQVVTPSMNVRRGTSPAAQNAVKTHCPKGHPLSGANLYLKPRGNGKVARVCLACRRYYQRILNYKYRAPTYKTDT